MSLIITACTSRKRRIAPAGLHASTMPHGPIEKLAEEWLDRLHAPHEVAPALKLYAGRGFLEAIQASEALQSSIMIVSAGLGLVDGRTPIPAYALSVVRGTHDCILEKVEGAPGAARWWELVSSPSPYGVRLEEALQATDGVVLVALSEAYLEMISPELARLAASELQRIRLITRAPAERIAANLLPLLMPYDDRLDGPDSSIRGTRGDFAARAARHFAEAVVQPAPLASAAVHAEMVRDALASWRHPPVFQRARYNDDQLMSIIREHWEAAQGRSTKLLRVLRDDLNIACEQGRFVGLMQRLRDERRVAA